MSETNDSIGFLFQNLSSLLSRYSDNLLNQKIGIGYSQYKIMSCLVMQRGPRQIDISHLLGQTEASVSRQVKLIQQKKLATIKLNPNNHREHIVELTPKGQLAYQKATYLLNDLYQPIFNKLSETEIIDFANSLNKILSYLDNR